MKGTELEQYMRQQKRGGAGRPPAKALASSLPSSSSSSGQYQKTTDYSSPSNGKQLPKWKADSLLFRQAMRMAKTVAAAEKQSKATGIPLHKLLPPSGSGSSASRGTFNQRATGNVSVGGGLDYDMGGSVDPSFIQCPHCGRHYSQKAGERHIPQVTVTSSMLSTV
jgi:hypothetical protein